MGLVVDPAQAEQQVERMGDMMPEQALSIIQGRLDNLMSTTQCSLSWGTALGILISLEREQRNEVAA